MLLLLFGAVVALASCDTGGVGEPEAAATPTAEDPCGELNQSSFQALAGEIKAASVLNIQTAPASLSGWWFVGGQVQEEIVPGEDVAIWAVDEDPTDRIVDEFVSVNHTASMASDWPSAPEDLSTADPAIERLLDCVRTVD